MKTKWTLFSLIFTMFVVFACEKQAEKEAVAEMKTPPAAQAKMSGLQYTAPEDWQEQQPTSRMRKAQYLLPGSDGQDDAEMAVFNFPGTGGSVEANLNRWYGQFSQPDGSMTSKKVAKQTRKVNNLNVTIVYVTGTYLKSTSGRMMGGEKVELPGYALLAAIVETGKSPWFFKATGPEKTINKWRPSFDQLVASFSL